VWCGGPPPPRAPPARGPTPVIFWGYLKTHKSEYKTKPPQPRRKPELKQTSKKPHKNTHENEKKLITTPEKPF
ncbi:hypothetical protein ACVGWL_00065, partial [Enterobacter asburiae]